MPYIARVSQQGSPKLSYVQQVLADGPVAWWRLGEISSSDAVDLISGNNAAWTFPAGVTWAVPGSIVGDPNTAVTLDGVTHFPRAVTNTLPLAATDNFTLEAWMKPTTQQDIVGSVIYCGDGTNGYCLAVNSGNFPRGITNGPGLTDPPANPLPVNIWSHVVLKRESGVSKLYVNGVRADPGTNNTGTPIAPTTRTVIGCKGDLALWFYDGSIDEVASYATPLSDARILAHYNAGRDGSFPAAINLCTNGGFESNTAGWTAQGPNTISSSTDFALFGTKSMKITLNDVGNFRSVLYAATLTPVVHTLSAYIYIPVGTPIANGAAIEVRDWTGGTGTDTESAEINISTAGNWVRRYLNLTPAGGDLTGNFYINFHGGTVGSILYVDGVQIETGPYATAYVDTP